MYGIQGRGNAIPGADTFFKSGPHSNLPDSDHRVPKFIDGRRHMEPRRGTGPQLKASLVLIFNINHGEA